jgi:tetratricopeptide (TPR) repeat protein
MTLRLSPKTHASVAALIATGAIFVTWPAVADNAEHEHVLGDRLGTVEFAVACADPVQDDFSRAMALYHSFAWSHAGEAFEAIAKEDPACGMAHWGRAMVMLDNPFLWPGTLTPEKLDAIAAALEDAQAAGLHDTREEGYVAAVEAFVRDRDRLDHRARVTAFEEKMGEVAAANPEDMEAAILHALVTSANFDPADRTYANQKRAAEILEPLFDERPEHPGVAHYLIHTYDYPPLAQRGLEAARRYSEIAPDAPHALHMPSHIFTRVGQWQESIASNSTSAEVDAKSTFNSHHAYDYKVYAHLQLAQDRTAEEMLKQAEALPRSDHFAAAFAFAAMPARAALEQDDWARAKGLELLPRADDFPWEKYPHAEAINAFARGVGAGLAGDAEAARVEQARLKDLREATKPAYWIEQVDIQADIVAALALCAEDQAEGCIEALRDSAAREDATEKHVVTPGPILPAREILADILLEQDRPEEALIEYEAVLDKEPNRYRALAGAAKAAQGAGKTEKARAHARHLIEQAGAAESKRPSLELARSIADGS